jgi:hypothetical protein
MSLFWLMQSSSFTGYKSRRGRVPARRSRREYNLPQSIALNDALRQRAKERLASKFPIY